MDQGSCLRHVPCDEEDICFVRAHAALDVRTWIAFWVQYLFVPAPEMNWTSGVSRYIFDLLTIKYICVCPDSERFQSRFASRVVESACFNPLKTTQCKAISCILPALAHVSTPLVAKPRSSHLASLQYHGNGKEFDDGHGGVLDSQPIRCALLLVQYVQSLWYDVISAYRFVLWQRIQREGFCLDLHSMLRNPVLCAFRIHSVLA